MKIAIPIDFDNKSYKINKAYVDYITEAKMTPIIITPSNIKLISQCQGLLLPGGIDIDPMYYGLDNYSSYNINPSKDEFERSIFYKAIKYQLPIFGICRGFQLIMYETLLTYQNKTLSIMFKQHINGHSQVENIAASRHIKSHKVNINGKILYGMKKITETGVNSMHHQGVVLKDAEKNLNNFQNHPYINIIAWTNKINSHKDEDLILIEGIKINLWNNNIVAVQWHPEELKDIELISYFFNNEYKEEILPQLTTKKEYKYVHL